MTELNERDCTKIIYDIWLTKIKGIGPVKQKALLKEFITSENVFYADKEQLSHVKTIDKSNITEIFNNRQLDQAKATFDRCIKKGINIISIKDDYYPALAKDIPDMPTILYYKCTLKINICGSAIIGARRCSRDGKEKAINLAKQFAIEQIPVISGMAKGIDSYAHTACIMNGGYTVAVLGNGLDICYPKEHDLLMKRIEETGLLISEYEPGIPPSTYNFPRRNRIIAAIAKEIYIPEAGKGSGALITAEFGKKYGKILHYL